MSDEAPSPPPTVEEKKEAARQRRRWLTLAEVLGVAAVVISGLTLWNNYQQRTSEEAEKAAAREQASAAAQTLILRATADRRGERLSLAPADPAQTIQEQRFLFPGELGVGAVETVSDPGIEADWFARPLVRLRRGDRDSRGDARLPVVIETSFIVGGDRHRDVAIYDIGYRIEEGGLLDGDEVRLRGLARVERVSPEGAQTRLDALWQARRPAAPAS